jgi:hypothetical protein
MREGHRRLKPTGRAVAARFVAANAIGWSAFLAVVATGGAMPFWAVPLVFGGAVTWAAGALTHRLSSRIGFGVATGLGLAGSVLGLVGTQAMTGHESFVSSLPMVVPVVVAFVFASAVGLLPLGADLGMRAWRFGVVGFAAGAFVGGTFALMMLLVPKAILPPLGYLMTIPFGMPMWLPSIGGGLAVARAGDRHPAINGGRRRSTRHK